MKRLTIKLLTLCTAVFFIVATASADILNEPRNYGNPNFVESNGDNHIINSLGARGGIQYAGYNLIPGQEYKLTYSTIIEQGTLIPMIGYKSSNSDFEGIYDRVSQSVETPHERYFTVDPESDGEDFRLVFQTRDAEVQLLNVSLELSDRDEINYLRNGEFDLANGWVRYGNPNSGVIEDSLYLVDSIGRRGGFQQNLQLEPGEYQLDFSVNVEDGGLVVPIIGVNTSNRDFDPESAFRIGNTNGVFSERRRNFTITENEAGEDIRFVFQTKNALAQFDYVRLSKINENSAEITVSGNLQTKVAILGESNFNALDFVIRNESDNNSLTVEEITFSIDVLESETDVSSIINRLSLLKDGVLVGRQTREDFVENTITFDNFEPFEIGADSSSNITVTLDVSNNENIIEETIKFTIEAIETTENFEIANLPFRALDSIEVREKGEMLMFYYEAAPFDLFEGELSEPMGNIHIISRYEDIEIETLSITSQLALDDYFSEIHLYEANSGELVVSKFVESGEVIIHDLEYAVNEGTIDLFVKVVLKEANGNLNETSSNELELDFAVNEAVGLFSNKIIEF